MNAQAIKRGLNLREYESSSDTDLENLKDFEPSPLSEDSGSLNSVIK